MPRAAPRGAAVARLAGPEDGIARRLRGLFRQRGLDADSEAGSGRGRAGLLVGHDQGRIAIECRLDGPDAKRQAVRDAAGRLAATGRIDAAFAVVCPPGCSEESLRGGTDLWVSLVDGYAAGSALGRRAPGAGGPEDPAGAIARARWTRCTVAELADRMRNVHRDVGDPDTIACRLRDAVDAAAGMLSEDERWELCENFGIEPRDGECGPAARRIMLAVASASMFHARLGPHLLAMRPEIDARTGRKFRGAWNPETLDECYRGPDTQSRLYDAWWMIRAADDKPVFEAGMGALDSSHRKSFGRAVRIVADWARYAAGQVGGVRHDIFGRIFHTLLGDAQFDGSFYTSVPAATLLAGLALPAAPPLGRLESFRVVDPACGTGTLLMAAAERLRAASPGGDAGYARLIEDVLVGFDINVDALHIAATTLGLLSPATRFDSLNLYRIPLGMEEGASSATAGSLELYAHGGLLPFIGRPGARPPRRPGEDDADPLHEYAYSADLVIMNPPYTRNDKRHDQLGKAAEEAVKRRESELLASSPVKLDRTSSGLMFLVLGEYLCGDTGTLACVFPLSSATAPSARGIRRFLAERFDIEYLVASHDPKREYFSENTAIAELLLVMRRKAGGEGGRAPSAPGGSRSRSTSVVTLLENPSTAGGAAALAAGIAAGRPGRLATVDTVPARSAAAGDWSRVLFASPFLHRAYMDMRDGRRFEAARLGEAAGIGCGRDVRGCFDVGQAPGRGARASMYGHDTSRVVSIENRPYAYLVPKRGKEARADLVWSRASHLLFPEKLRLNLAHVTAVCSPDETVGNSWYSVRLREGGAADRLRWSKAMAVFLNSTPGIVAVLGARIPTVLSRPRFSIAGARDMPVPRLSAGQAAELAGAYDRYGREPIGRFAEPDDPVRRGIDDAVSSALGMPGEAVARMRRELAREPMCTGRRYEA